MAEIELHVLNRQCLNRQIAKMEELKSDTDEWQNHWYNKNLKNNWQFTNDKALIKHSRFFPSISY